MSMRRSGGAPSVIETIRLNLTVLERAVGQGDTGTAKRAIDAAEMMFRGLRDVASGAGCDVGPSVWRSAGAPPEHGAVNDSNELARPEGVRPSAAALPPAQPDQGVKSEATAPCENLEVSPGPTLAEFTTAVRQVLGDFITPPAQTPWLVGVEDRAWTWGILARLTWAWWCCMAALVWRGGCRVVKGSHK